MVPCDKEHSSRHTTPPSTRQRERACATLCTCYDYLLLLRLLLNLCYCQLKINNNLTLARLEVTADGKNRVKVWCAYCHGKSQTASEGHTRSCTGLSNAATMHQIRAHVCVPACERDTTASNKLVTYLTYVQHEHR